MKNFQFSIFNFQKKKNLQPATYLPALLRKAMQAGNLPPFLGFTLIEILVAVSIVFILLSMTYAGYNSLNQRQRLISSGQNLKNILRDAQSRVVNAEMDCDNCDCKSAATGALSGWYVDFDTRQMYGECKSQVGTTITFSPKEFDFSTEITITPYITPATKLFFRSNPPGVDQSATICLSTQGLSGSFYKVVVNKAGAISDDGTLTTTCVP